MTDPRRSIPGVDALLETDAFRPLVRRAGRDRVIRELRHVQARLRDRLVQVDTGHGAGGAQRSPDALNQDRIGDPVWYAAQVAVELDRGDRPSLRRVINATGVVLHTNLGRAPLADRAVRAMMAATGYGSLEIALETGTRGSRHEHCVGLLRELTGAPAALVVNNNAAAVMLVLNTLARGRDAVISRGELVEIGGSFRVAEIMARSGVGMREVGSTNRTHLRDYEAELAGAALILKVHRSNFRLEGFTAEVPAADLAALAREHGVPLVHDLGSGALLDMRRLGLPSEPTAADGLAEGADVVTLSGDKLLGGPQAGIILGRPDLVDAMRANPLCRSVRPDKLTLAALEATLALYRDPETAVREIPTLRMLGADARDLETRAKAMALRLEDAGIPGAVEPAAGAVGGGAYPGVELPGFAVVVRPPNAEELARRLRTGDPPVVARVRDDRVWLDPRTVSPAEEDELVVAVIRAFGEDPDA